MRILALQHVDFESIGMIEDWAEAHGHSLQIIRLYRGDALPPLGELDMLVIMGGSMSVHDEQKYPWLLSEKAFIRNAIEAEKYVLGICLGAQLIASVLGAKVYPNPVKEIGWFPAAIVDDALSEPILSGLNHAMQVFHWHGDTFDLPQDARLLMSSKACKNQAFIYKKRVLGLQFHLEMTKEGIENIIENCRSEIHPAETIQSESAIRTGITAFPTCKSELFSVLDKFSR